MGLDALHAIHAEIAAERSAGRIVTRIRVSSTAIEGAVVALPVTSLRHLLGIRPEKRVEILVHAFDWERLLRELGPQEPLEDGEPDQPVRIDGVRIEHYA